MTPSLSSRRVRLNALGVLVLAVGLSVGGLVYWYNNAESDDDVLAAQDQSKAYDQAMQRNIGAVGLLMDRWTQTLEKFTRPRPLAIMLMLATGATAGGCFVAAARRRD